MAGKRRIVIDTGAVFAMLDNRDQWHGSAVKLFRDLPKPFYTCESVMSETCFLLESAGITNERAFGLLSAGVIKLDFHLDAEIEMVNALMRKYENVPMSLADACLVRMSEVHETAGIFTFDSDFKIYRRHGKHVINTLPSGDFE